MRTPEMPAENFNFHDHVRETSESAVASALHPAYSGQEPLSGALGVIADGIAAVPLASQEHYLYLTWWNTAMQYAVHPDAQETKMGAFFGRIPHDISLPNGLVQAAEEVTRDGNMTERSKFLFGEAATRYESIYQAIPPANFEERAAVISEYVRLADSQKTVDSSHGRANALHIAEHMLALSQDLAAHPQHHSLHEQLETDMHEVLVTVGYLDDERAKALYRATESPFYKLLTRELVLRNFARDLLEVDEPEAALKIINVSAHKNTSLEPAWGRILDTIDEDPETAQELIDLIEKEFSDFYEQVDDLDYFGNMFEALYEAQRDHSLVRAIRTWEATGLTNALHKFAYRCGQENRTHRFNMMLQDLGATPERTEAAQHWYATGAEKAPTDQASTSDPASRNET